MIFKGNLGEVLAENCIVRGKPFDLGGGGMVETWSIQQNFSPLINEVDKGCII